MKNRTKLRYIAFSLVVLMIVSLFQVPERTYAQFDLDINADAAIAIEPTTGKILYGKNIDTPLGIASMTKMMTEYLLFEAIEEGRLSWDQEQIISDYAYAISQNRGLSNVPLNVGKPYTIQELYEALAIYSANGATIAIAEAIAGSETNFVRMMNEKAEELGLDNYRFVNSSGLNNSDLQGMHPEGTGAEDDNMMSARSTAKLAARLIKDYPQVLETASIPQKVFRENTDAIQMINWNKMLPERIYGYEGVDGLKTGFTDFAGYSFTGTAQRGDMRIITVVMNAKNENGITTDQARFDETKKMMDFAFNNFTMQEVIPSNYTVKEYESLPVIKGKEDTVKIQTEESIKMMVRKGEEEAYQPVVTLDESKLNEDGELTAPIEKGERVGVLTVELQEGDLGYLSDEFTPVVNVVATEDVEKANWFVLMMRGIGGFFSNLWTGITDTVKGWF